MIELVEISSKEEVKDEYFVNDLSVENNHNYVANDYIVHNCITSSNTSVHYPQASLIDECNRYTSHSDDDTKIIADGGIRNYSDVIKALALGADYVMIGGLFAGCVESCGDKYIVDKDGSRIFIEDQDYDNIYSVMTEGKHVVTEFFGMASAQGQISIDGKKTKTSEGITKYVDVKFKLSKWVENMKDYIKSAMSYCDCYNLKKFIGKQTLVINSIAEINAVNK